jgi:3-hydroxyacyl-[acyl-carrier-protein] dehydratase
MVVNTASPVLSVEILEILKHIPHRYPFLLVDRVDGCVPNDWVKATKNVSLNDHFFNGVPTSLRVMPQMLIVEALAQTAGVLCHFSGFLDGPGHPLMFLAGLDRCRFGREARPGDQLRLECKMSRVMRGIVKMSGIASIRGEKVLEAGLTAAVRQTEISTSSP